MVASVRLPHATYATHPASATVKTAMNQTLHKTMLVTAKGLTLYSLSIERRGRFICKEKFCLSLWTPLLARKWASRRAYPASAR